MVGAVVVSPRPGGVAGRERSDLHVDCPCREGRASLRGRAGHWKGVPERTFCDQLSSAVWNGRADGTRMAQDVGKLQIAMDNSGDCESGADLQGCAPSAGSSHGINRLITRRS